MASILKVKDENGNIIDIPAIKGDKGDPYELTEADKMEIKEAVIEEIQRVFYCDSGTNCNLYDREFKKDETYPQNIEAWIGDYIISDGILYEVKFVNRSCYQANRIASILPDERPTITTEPVELMGSVNIDTPRMSCLTVADLWGSLSDIPEGKEIKSIEFRLFNDDTGEYEKWVDIRDMYTVDNTPYVLHMSKVYIADEINTFAIVAPVFHEGNYIHTALGAYKNGQTRITYYND